MNSDVGLQAISSDIATPKGSSTNLAKQGQTKSTEESKHAVSSLNVFQWWTGGSEVKKAGAEGDSDSRGNREFPWQFFLGV